MNPFSRPRRMPAGLYLLPMIVFAIMAVSPWAAPAIAQEGSDEEAGPTVPSRRLQRALLDIVE